MTPTYQQEQIATRYMLQGVQHWGQSDAERQKAKHDYLAAAGFGPESVEGEHWLADVLHTMERGEFNGEVRHLTNRLASAAALRTTT